MTRGTSGPEFYEDCQPGDHQVTSGRTITETDVVMFAAVSGDWNALHTDADFARDGPYGERIAHGMLTLVVGMNLLFRQSGAAAALLPAALVAVTGYENIKFLLPVKIGDTLRVHAELIDMTRVFHSQGLLSVRFRILNQRAEAVASGRLGVLVQCRTEAPIEGSGAGR
jgi:acyl dehydratase